MIIVKRWVTSMIAVSCLLLEPELLWASDDEKSGQAQRSVLAKEYRLLFSLKSNYAKLIYVDADNYQLLLPVSEVMPVLAFSDRPERLARRLQPSDFAQLVHSGKYSFDKKKPSIVVTFDAEEPVSHAYELVGYQKDSSFVQYNLRYLNDSSEFPTPEEGPVTVFMDGFVGRLPS